MIESLKQVAKTNHVPILSDEGLAFLLDTIKINHIKRVLEIGTAIGYSAICMASFGVYVDTVEREIHAYKQAEINIKRSGLQSKINIIFGDALEIELPKRKYDLIFIDAAKAQYERFFTRFEPLLSQEGMIVCDNLDFHHLDPKEVSRNTRQLLRKIEQFKVFLRNHKQFNTTFHRVGDGMSISRRKK